MILKNYNVERKRIIFFLFRKKIIFLNIQRAAFLVSNSLCEISICSVNYFPWARSDQKEILNQLTCSIIGRWLRLLQVKRRLVNSPARIPSLESKF